MEDNIEELQSLIDNNIVTLMEIAKIYMLYRLERLVRSWWDRSYPSDIFTGESCDEGPLKVVEIRNVLDMIKDQEEKIESYKSKYRIQE